MAKGKMIPKKSMPRSPSMPMHTDAAMDKVGMGSGMVGKKGKKRRFPPPPPAVQAGGTGPGFTAPGGY